MGLSNEKIVELWGQLIREQGCPVTAADRLSAYEAGMRTALVWLAGRVELPMEGTASDA